MLNYDTRVQIIDSIEKLFNWVIARIITAASRLRTFREIDS